MNLWSVCVPSSCTLKSLGSEGPCWCICWWYLWSSCGSLWGQELWKNGSCSNWCHYSGVCGQWVKTRILCSSAGESCWAVCSVPPLGHWLISTKGWQKLPVLGVSITFIVDKTVASNNSLSWSYAVTSYRRHFLALVSFCRCSVAEIFKTCNYNILRIMGNSWNSKV